MQACSLPTTIQLLLPPLSPATALEKQNEHFVSQRCEATKSSKCKLHLGSKGITSYEQGTTGEMRDPASAMLFTNNDQWMPKEQYQDRTSIHQLPYVFHQYSEVHSSQISEPERVVFVLTCHGRLFFHEMSNNYFNQGTPWTQQHLWQRLSHCNYILYECLLVKVCSVVSSHSYSQ